MAEPGIELLDEPLTGGCQCGAFRYEIGMKPVKSHFCHCRMCQRAVGNVFAALSPVRKKHFRWLKGEPPAYKSSTAATRGFCDKCGTPLYFAYNSTGWIAVTTGSLDHPEKVPPEIHYGVEAQIPWLHLHEDLPREATSENADMQDMKVFQSGTD